MAKQKVCQWKMGRRCLRNDCQVTKSDCEGCKEYKSQEEAEETVADHLAKIPSGEAAKLIVAMVNEVGFPDKVALWLRTPWEEVYGKS